MMRVPRSARPSTMFDVPVGSRVSIDGGEWMNVARCTPRRAFGTRPHHWELEVR